MAISSTGLTIQTYEEVLDDIIRLEQENVSSTIDVSDDTALGQTNQIFAQRIALVNEGIQDIYDQRNLYTAEGKALDDNISWMGITRQGDSATAGEAYFTGDDGTIIPSGSFVHYPAIIENYTTDAVVVIAKGVARDLTFSVLTVLDTTLYSVSVQGVDYEFTSDSDATDLEIIAGLVAAINLPADPSFTATDHLDGTATVDSLSIGGVTPANLIFDVSTDLQIDSVSTAGNITGVNTGPIAAPALTITDILSPVNGWQSISNPEALTIGRNEETDSELRIRAVTFRSASGKATVDAITSAILAIDGVSSTSVNNRKVSEAMGDWTITVDDVQDTTDYDVTINNVLYTFTSDGSATADEIAQGLVSVINTATPQQWAAVDNTGTTTGTLLITSDTLFTISLSLDATMSFLEGQPAGSIQAVVAGGDDDVEIAQAIWDNVGGGVEVWALNDDTIVTETVVDHNGDNHQISFNRPESITTVVEVRYKVFDTGVYPEDDATAATAIKDALVIFGNAMGAGEDVLASEFEGTVYGAVGGIYDVYIEIIAATDPSQTSASDDRDAEPTTAITIASAEEIFFDADTITVINAT